MDNSRAYRIILQKYFILFVFIILAAGCQPLVITSKTYGTETAQILTFEDAEIKCSVSQVIYGSSCMNNIYLQFIPLSNTEIEIRNINGQMKWLQDKKIIDSPFYLSHIIPSLNIGYDQTRDSSYAPGETVAEKFRKISGTDNYLMYEIEFSDSSYKNIPLSVDKLIVDFQIELTSGGKTKQYSKTVNFNAVTHRNMIPLGRND